MQKSYLSENLSDIKVSQVILGSWGLGGEPFWQNVDKGIAIKTILQAFESGITTIDTAPIYGFGRSEKYIGEAIALSKLKREKIVLATKVGLRWKTENLASSYKSLKKDSIIEEVENSLRRLKSDYIDLLQIHWPDPLTSLEESLTAMGKLRDQGKIKAIGISNFSAVEINEAAKIEKIVSLQPPYNLLQRDIETDIIPAAINHNIGLIPYSPLASGLLTGKYDLSSRYNDWRGKKNFGIFKEPLYKDALLKIEKLKQLLAKYKLPLSAVSIRWLLKRESVKAVIVGAMNPDQVIKNAEAATIEIDPEIFDAIDRLI